MGTLSDFGQIALKWDPKNLEIRTMSVEKTLEPLVLQVTTLVNTKGPSKKKKGKSKRASALVAAVEKATENFIQKGEQIAYENPDITQEMLAAVDEVRKTGDGMSIAAREFSEDPCSSLKRGNMVRAARNLLSAVTRLLILADMVDVHLLLKSLHVVEDDLNKLKNASSQDELMDNMRQFGRNAGELIKQAAKRQQELKDPQLRDDLAAARAMLKKHSTMLLTASKVYVRHPELDLAKVNRDFILKQVCDAVNTISDVAQGKSSQPTDIYSGAGELAAALDDFDEGIIMDPMLRFSSSPIVPHVATEDSVISGFGVTKGTIVFINNYVLNTSAKYWNEPGTFEPNRFLEKEMFSENVSAPSTICTKRRNSEGSDSGVELEKETISTSSSENSISVTNRKDEKSQQEHLKKNYKFVLKKNIPHFLPFSIGKRTCIGQNLVRGFGFILLSNILQRYNVSSKDLSSIKISPASVALPAKTFPLVFTPRSIA